MSFEAVIQSVGGDDSTMDKSLIMAVMGIAWTWYTTLEPWRIFCWDQLKNTFLENFQANYDDPVTARHLFVVKKGAKESLRSYVRRFIHVKCHAVDLSDDSIIDAAKQGLRPELLRKKLTRSLP